MGHFYGGRKMDYLQFKEELTQKLEERTGIQVISRKITKNNNVILDSVTMQEEDTKVAPTIYLDPFYEDFQQGKTMDEIMAEIIRLDEENRNSDFEEVVSDFLCFDKMKSRISYKLVNYEKNAEILQKIPHRRFLDLAVVYMVVDFDSKNGMATILINQFHADVWNVTEEVLYQLAKENTPRLLPYEIRNIQTILKEMAILTDFSDEKLDGLANEYVPMYVLTNVYKNMGAACILYDGVLEEIAKTIDGDFYILPSSVHETIILKDDGRSGAGYFRQMVKEVNSTQVSEEEILADSVYEYRQCTGLKIL